MLLPASTDPTHLVRLTAPPPSLLWLQVTLVLLQAVPLTLFFYFALTSWNHHYAWLYLPLAGLRLFFLGLMSTLNVRALQHEVHESSDGKGSTTLSLYRFLVMDGPLQRVAPYVQATGWTVLVVGVLSLRPVFFYSQVAGWGSSPCGRSSCTRDTSLSLLTAVPPVVYNPNGYFPAGEHQAFDATGATSYVFCDFGDACRWADDNRQEVRTYELLAGGCEVNYDAPMEDETGFITQRLEDYPNPGLGVRLGWSPCRRANDQGGTSECRGQRRQATCAPESTGSDCNSTVASKRVWTGKRVCATCATYEDAFLSLWGAIDGYPTFADPDTTCIPKADRSVNVWCFICPGRDETVDKGDLEAILWFNGVFVLEPIVALLLVFVRLRTLGSSQVPDAIAVAEAQPPDKDEKPREAAASSAPSAVAMAGGGTPSSRLRLPMFSLMSRRRQQVRRRALSASPT